MSRFGNALGAEMQADSNKYAPTPPVPRETELGTICNALDGVTSDLSLVLDRIERAIDRLNGARPKEAASGGIGAQVAGHSSVTNALKSTLGYLGNHNKFALSLAERLEEIV